jgi:hypothetical protein
MGLETPACQIDLWVILSPKREGGARVRLPVVRQFYVRPGVSDHGQGPYFVHTLVRLETFLFEPRRRAKAFPPLAARPEFAVIDLLHLALDQGRQVVDAIGALSSGFGHTRKILRFLA